MSTVLQARDLTRYYDVAQGFLKPGAGQGAQRRIV
jgi:dipeptide transport system ATP-binding protein